MTDERQRVANAREVIVDTLQDQWAPEPHLRAREFLAAQPARAQDAAIERPGGIVRGEFAGECDAEEGPREVLRAPDINTDDRLRLELPGGLLERLADDRLEESLPVFEVSRWLIDDDASAGAFFYDEESSVTFCDGGDGPTLGNAVFDPNVVQDDPAEILLAVDLNNNGKRDRLGTDKPADDQPDEPGGAPRPPKPDGPDKPKRPRSSKK